MWGCLQCMKNFINKYSEGKIQQQEMLRRNRESLGKIGRLQHIQRLQNHRRRTATNPAGTLRRTMSKATSNILRPTVRGVNFGDSTIIKSGGSAALISGRQPVPSPNSAPAESLDTSISISISADAQLGIMGKNLAKNKSTFFRIQEKVSSLYSYQEISNTGSTIGGPLKDGSVSPRLPVGVTPPDGSR